MFFCRLQYYQILSKISNIIKCYQKSDIIEFFQGDGESLPDTPPNEAAAAAQAIRNSHQTKSSLFLAADEAGFIFDFDLIRSVRPALDEFLH